MLRKIEVVPYDPAWITEFETEGKRISLALGEMVTRLHHKRHLAFRDYMSAHAAEARAYGELKQGLAILHPHDIQAYMDGKDAFIKEHEAKAIAWRTSQNPSSPK